MVVLIERECKAFLACIVATGERPVPVRIARSANRDLDDEIPEDILELPLIKEMDPAIEELPTGHTDF